MEYLRVGEHYNFISSVGDLANITIYPDDHLKLVELSVNERVSKRHRREKGGTEPVITQEYRLIFLNQRTGKHQTVLLGENYKQIIEHNYAESLRYKLLLLSSL